MTTTVVRAERQLGRGTRVLLIIAFFVTVGLIPVGAIPWLYRAAIVGVFAALLWLARWAHPASFRPPTSVTEIDEQGVRRMYAGKLLEGVRWDDLVKVSIMTTDEGPFVEDFFWLLQAADGSGAAIGQEQASEIDLLGRLQRLPRFDNVAVIEASGCCENREFVCWEGEAGEATIAGAAAVAA